MADIIYTYKNEVYANITNKCDCACTFCIRSQKDAIGDATTLWHKVDPTYNEIIAAIDAFDLQAMRNSSSAATVNQPARWISLRKQLNM